MSLTSLYRSTKTRNSRGQDTLNSNLLKYKSLSNIPFTTDISYHQTYGVPLPKASIQILEDIISALTCRACDINPNTRELHTICIWRVPQEAIYRCCFIQPELCSATCSFPKVYMENARNAISEVSLSLPDIPKCTLQENNLYPQISGRMAPYVVDKLNFTVKWGFTNIARSYILFLITTENGTSLYTLSYSSMLILSKFFSENAICVYDSKSNLFKITVSPASSIDPHKANKNTCMNIYNDGSFRLQGSPYAMERVCKSFRESLINISKSYSWISFTDKLKPINAHDHQ